MVLLTMTASIVELLTRMDEKGAEEIVHDPKAASTSDEPSLAAPAIGNPISHGQIIDIWNGLCRCCVLRCELRLAHEPMLLEGWKRLFQGCNSGLSVDHGKEAGAADLTLNEVLEIWGCLAKRQASNDGREQHIQHLAQQLPDWTVSPESVIPVPSTRPTVRNTPN